MASGRPFAAKYYLQVTDDHCSQGAEAPDQADGAPSSVFDGRPAQPVQALQNALQHIVANARTASRAQVGGSANFAICTEIRSDATGCEDAKIELMGDTGLEPVTSRV